jgi:DNA (cytosine-5)-methyltransferase 1
MTGRFKTIPIVDIFAGPGGLSEGFHSALPADSGVRFSSVLAIEKDPVACETLRLRSFFNQFRRRRVPEAYYQVIRGERAQSDLQGYPEWSVADSSVWNAELGKIAVDELHGKIRDRLSGRQDWVLLGGPPCQAYSLVGRARMTGLGHKARVSLPATGDIEKLRRDKLTAFAKDIRHTLYREYLRVVAVHQPAVFVMENVKGILSSKIYRDNLSERVFSQIRDDLAAPWEALSDDPILSDLKKFRRGKPQNYRLYSFVAETAGRDVSDKEFLIRSENYGVPQARHRVVLLGVREDMLGRPEVLCQSQTNTVRDAIGGMPPLRSGLSKEEDTTRSWLEALQYCFPPDLRSEVTNQAVKKTILKVIGRSSARLSRGSSYLKSPMLRTHGGASLLRWLSDGRLGGVLQHESRTHMRSDLGRYLFAAATAACTKRSPRLPDWPKYLLPKHRNVDLYRSNETPSGGMFVDRFKVQLWDKPSSTVTSHIAKDGHYFIHPDPFQSRSLTVREAARLQTFPDNYYFCGNRTQQYHQVGNAVPPYLALQMANVVAKFLASRSIFQSNT